jgi:hypothetical protein
VGTLGRACAVPVENGSVSSTNGVMRPMQAGGVKSRAAFESISGIAGDLHYELRFAWAHQTLT